MKHLHEDLLGTSDRVQRGQAAFKTVVLKPCEAIVAP
jgi:hypothetical protein